MANTMLCSSMTICVVLISLANRCGTAVGQQGSQRERAGHKLPTTSASLDPSEVARQNRITQHILAQYLQRRLFPHLARPPSSSLPLINISPRTKGASSSSHTSSSNDDEQAIDFDPDDPDVQLDQEALDHELETVESEQISNVFDESRNLIEGRGGLRRPSGGLQREKCALICGPPESLPTSTTSVVGSTVLQQSTTTPKTTTTPLDDLEMEIDDDDTIEYLNDCANCVDDGPAINKWTMPLLKLGEKRYYLGIFFRANWYRAAQYCRYHGMHLASISSQEENDKLEKHIRDFGLGHEHFWTSGTDQAEEGTFFWMSTGRPITFTNWNTGEPNNFRYENGEEEHCLELWNRDGKGLKWNDSPCSFETYFVCEVGM